MSWINQKPEGRRNPQVIQDIEGPGEFNIDAYEIIDNNIPSKN